MSEQVLAPCMHYSDGDLTTSVCKYPGIPDKFPSMASHEPTKGTHPCFYCMAAVWTTPSNMLIQSELERMRSCDGYQPKTNAQSPLPDSE